MHEAGHPEEPVDQSVANELLARFRRWLFAGMIVLAVLGALRHVQNPPIWDEGVFLATADTLGQADPYFSDIDYRPPMLIWLLKGVSFLVPLPIGGRLLEVLLFVLGIVLLIRMGTKLWGEAEGIVAGLLMVTAPYFLMWSGAILSDIPSAVLAIATVYFAYLGAEGRPWFALGGGLLLAAAFLMRWPTIFVGAAALTLLFTGALRVREALLYGLGFLAGVTPYFTWAWLRFGNPLQPILRASSAIEGSEPIADPTYYVRALLLVAAPLTLAGLLLYVSGLTRDRVRDWLRTDLPLIVWALVLPIYLSFVVHKEERYIAAAIPPLFLLSARGWVWAFKHRDYQWRVPVAIAALASFLCLGAFVDVFGLASQTKDDHMAVGSDIERAVPLIQKSFPSGGLVYSNHLWPVVAWETKLKTEALWPRDERFYSHFPANMPVDGLLVYVTGIPKEPNEDWLDARPEFHRLDTVGRLVIYAYQAPKETISMDEVQSKVDTAREAYHAGDWEGAVKALDGLSGSRPGVGCIQGWSLYKLGEIEAARRSFEELLQIGPEDTCGLTGLGYALLRLGDQAGAETSLREALAQDPKSVDALFGLGLSLMRQGRRDEAADAFRAVLEIKPDHSEALQFLDRVTRH